MSQAPIYLLYGDEPFLIDEAREKVMKLIVTEEAFQFDIASYDMNETPIEQALEEAETTPFLAEKRVVIIKNPSFLTAERRTASSVDHNLKRLEGYIQNPADHSIVIFEAPYKKLDERKKIVKALKNGANVVNTSALKEYEVGDWIKNEAKQMNVEIDPNAVIRLSQLIGNSLSQLKNELVKISLFVGEGEVITEETVELLVARSLEDNIFALIDHVVNKRMEHAFRTLYDLFEMNEEPIKIVALLARQFRIIYQVKELGRRGYSQKQMAAYLKLHPYAVQQAGRQGRHFSEEDCFHFLKKLEKIDYEMKIGQFDKELLLELFFTQIA